MIEGTIIVEERYGYRKAEGRNVLFTLPAPAGLEKALAEQVGQGHQDLNHTVFKCKSEQSFQFYYLWFWDGRMTVCLDVAWVPR